MNPKHATSFVVFLCSFLAVFAIVAPAAAQDTITVGTVTASGNTVDVPIYVRDASGTTLGRDQPAGARIQGFSIKVGYSPAASVQSATVSRAGITAGLQPGFGDNSLAQPGSVTWLVNFNEATDLVPFNLNAPAPGDQVAHIVFTLSSSAAPGSSIALSIDPDPSQTLLTDQGGTISESAANGGLTLVNGAINLPSLTLEILPSSRVIEVGESTTYSVQTSANVASNTTVTLTSSNPGIASMPPSVDIAGGSRSATFTVIGSAVGAATITATLPAGSGGANATAELTVNPATVGCTTPAAPQISGPSTADAGRQYTISWSAVNAATSYVIDESTDSNFLTATTTNVTGTSASFTHAAANRYYYRVRARNQSTGCNTTSVSSTTVSVLVSVAPVAQSRYLPVVGSVPGSLGSYFKTSVQLFNAKTTAVSGKIVFHTQAASGSSDDRSIAYSIQAGKSLSYADLLPAMGIDSGLGSADVIADAGSAFPVALVRVFNDGGAAGTTGLAEELLSANDALQSGDTAALIAPADQRFRLNIGVRTLEQGVSLTFTVRDKDGGVVKTTTRSYGATFFRQIGSSEILDGYVLAGGEAITVQVASGSAFVYGSTTDNTTQDPSVQFAKKIE
jgi:uncharacterized protein YjdB